MLQPNTIAKHVARLPTIARKNRGLLPTYRWLNEADGLEPRFWPTFRTAAPFG
jgi:endo-beta-N-acetylglucosaminidase D